MKRHPDITERGFTLIELAVAFAIVMLLAGIAVPVMNNVTRAELRAAASKTSGMVKATYDLAVLSGKPCRLVFDFKANTITPEMATGKVTLRDKDDPNADEDQELDPEEQERQAREQAETGNLNALIAIAKRDLAAPATVRKAANFIAAPGTVPFELPKSVKITDIVAEHMRDAAKDGKASIHFFPMGYVEHALIHFEDGEQNVFAVEIEPLTGRTRIEDKRLEYKEAK